MYNQKVEKFIYVPVVMGIDYSANFTGVVYDQWCENCDSTKTNFWFTSNLVRDKNNNHCSFLSKDINTVQKVDYICENIFGIINENRPHIVAIESPAFMASNQNASFQDGYAIIKYVLRTMNTKYVLVPPVSLKLFACGNSKADKLEVAQGIEDYFGVNYKEQTSHWDNLYDAHALYQIAKYCCEPHKIEYLPLEKQQVLYGILGETEKLKEVKKLRGKAKR